MCNLSDYIEEKGIQQGIQKGMEQGIQKGMEQGIQEGIEQGMEKGKIEQQLENLRAVMTNLNLPVEKAMDILNVPQEARARYMEQI